MNAMRSVVVTLGPPLREPWWWSEIQADPELCPLTYHRVVFRNKTAREITSAELVVFLFHMLPVYLRLRRRYDYMFTFECDLTTFALAFWQTVLLQRRPRHVVLQFIMREKTAALASRLKYAAMRWCFASLHRAICSASREAAYYQDVFGWPQGRTAFVPFHTSRKLIEPGDIGDDGYLLAAGRSYRDYPTLLAAVRGSGHRTIIVASHQGVPGLDGMDGVEVRKELSLPDLDRLVRRARVVVVPLLDTKLSAGQLVLLHAMALGKPIVASATTGTIDYIDDGVEGLLVPPGDAAAMRTAVGRLMSDSGLRERLGSAARQAVLERHLPHHYTHMVRAALRSERTSAPQGS